MDTKETISKYWDWRSQTYTNGTTGFREEEKSIWRQALNPFLKCSKDLKILDVGTGPGFLALILAEMGHRVTGVDISEGMLEKARDNARAMNLDVNFRHADGERLPFEDESFDLLVNRHLLWTLPNPDEAIADWVRVINQDGRILSIDGAWFDPSLCASFRRGLSKAASLISEQKLSSLNSAFENYYNPIRKELPMYSQSKPDQICSVFKEAGLCNVSFEYLREIQKFQDSSASILQRIAHPKPTFLVTGEKVRQ